MPLYIGEEAENGQGYLNLQCPEHGIVIVTVCYLSDEDFEKTYHCPECGTELKGWNAKGNPA